MSKPMSMSVKEYLIRTLAVKLAINEKTVEEVVNYQFKSANEAMDINHSVEISGFAKFIFNKKKAIKKLNNLLAKKEFMENVLTNPETSPAMFTKTTRTLSVTIDQINKLKPTIKHG